MRDSGRCDDGRFQFSRKKIDSARVVGYPSHSSRSQFSFAGGGEGKTPHSRGIVGEDQDKKMGGSN